jgi:hypothetical protein
MESIWGQSLHNLHCPQCDRRLMQRASRRFHTERRIPVYVGQVGTLRCPSGHGLLGIQALYDYRDMQGHPSTAPVSEITSSVR